VPSVEGGTMHVKVASPCKRDWSKMPGDEKVRACADCKLNVYNLSAMTEAEAQELVKQREGRVCVRFFVRPDGTALTRDCPVGVSRKRKTYAVAMSAVGALFLAPVMGAEQCQLTPPSELGLVDQARSFVQAVKVKLGLASAPVVMMGDVGP
jgi:hypothetical protein